MSNKIDSVVPKVKYNFWTWEEVMVRHKALLLNFNKPHSMM